MGTYFRPCRISTINCTIEVLGNIKNYVHQASISSQSNTQVNIQIKSDLFNDNKDGKVQGMCRMHDKIGVKES